MEIIRKSSETINPMEFYKMTQNSKNISLKDTEDITINIISWVVYSDINASGNEVELISIIDDQGLVYVTNSKTFRESFIKAVDFFEQNNSSFSVIKVIHGKSKAGRNFIDCEIIG